MALEKGAMIDWGMFFSGLYTSGEDAERSTDHYPRSKELKIGLLKAAIEKAGLTEE